ncbi:MAG: hypothetical protein JJ896_08005 [Rhodothermales bacterium]|nr:hypothetical protein [Rhodothermales bacterium]MBO6779584.1 hypothetical protein [Rhodothermales bacterium]
MKLGSSKDLVLGIAVTYRAVHGVLVRDTPNGPEVVRHFDRPRSATDSSAMESGGSAQQEFHYVEDNDPDVAFASAAADHSSLFLSSEFSDTEVINGEVAPSTVEIELTDILDECAEAGYPDPYVVFCVGSTDLDYHEVFVRGKAKPGDRPAKKKKSKKRHESSKLLQHLAATTDAKFNPDQTVFVPMTPSEERVPRYLAICARGSEIIVPTLKRLAARNRRINVGVIETEVSLLLGTVRRLVADSDDGRTPPTRLLVRVGADDTVIMLIEGGNLSHVESLRSITSFDPADTVCSRILLLQDEHGFADPDEILVLGEENEESLTRRLTEFFEESKVQSIREVLPRSADDLDEEYSREATLAAAAVVRYLYDPAGKTHFEPISLLPRKLFRRGPRLDQFKWQTVPLMVLLFATSLFFVHRYIRQSQETQALNDKLAEYPAELIESNKGDLQARIDSIQAVSAGYIQALAVLDSILVGSDKWSRAMERASAEAAAVPGIWIETWEQEGESLELIGTATNRDHLVRYATRMDGIIKSMSFGEIREQPVFKFTMDVPLPHELPAAAQFLRDQAEQSGE